jgi:hypothetical protein
MAIQRGLAKVIAGYRNGGDRILTVSRLTLFLLSY